MRQSITPVQSRIPVHIECPAVYLMSRCLVTMATKYEYNSIFVKRPLVGMFYPTRADVCVSFDKKELH